MEERITFAKIYGELFSALEKNPQQYELFTKPYNKPLLTSFTAMEGRYYRNNPDFRFMLVGRAVNRWDEMRNYADTLTHSEFVKSSLANLYNEPTVLCGGKDRFEWIGDPNNEYSTPTNKFRPGIDGSELGITNFPYHLSRPLWNYSKDIWCTLSGSNPATTWKNRWFENIVWSNLYKIAPSIGGNPDEKLKRLQFESSAKLLNQEISYFQPTHILFLTGYKEWFEPFNTKCFDNKITVEKRGVVEAAGVKRTNTYTSRIVVAERPERRNKSKYISDVVSVFQAL